MHILFIQNTIYEPAISFCLNGSSQLYNPVWITDTYSMYKLHSAGCWSLLQTWLITKNIKRIKKHSCTVITVRYQVVVGSIPYSSKNVDSKYNQYVCSSSKKRHRNFSHTALYFYEVVHVYQLVRVCKEEDKVASHFRMHMQTEYNSITLAATWAGYRRRCLLTSANR